MNRLLKVAITGPESTGKSMIAQELADHYSTVWVPEYARVHLLKLDQPYVYDDVLEIAQNQKASEAAFEPLANKIMFCDTELLVTKIWCEDKFNTCHSWILKQLEQQHYDLYLLMDADLPWQYDPLREDQGNRKYLFDLYRNELENFNFNYRVVSGKDDSRLKNALRFIDELIEKNNSAIMTARQADKLTTQQAVKFDNII